MATILVAEDNQAVRALLGTALSHAGFDVREAADGDEAWGLLQTGVFDALVTDLHLPGRSGLALLQAVRADAVLRTTPVLVVTGDHAACNAAVEAGADGCLAKPFSLVAVRQAVGAAIAARAGAVTTGGVGTRGTGASSGLETATL